MIAMETEPALDSPLAALARISKEVVGPDAASVDREARFPSASFDALRSEGLLAAFVPSRFGGGGASLSDLAAMCRLLANECSSTGMIFAMHQIQVACLIEHGQGHPYFDDLLADLARSGRLIASATSEAGIGGDVRSSSCAVERDGDTFHLEKNASVISYGEHVDDVLVTARRDPSAPPSDQVLVHVQRPRLQLDPYGEWDTLGMRGTCSIGFQLVADGSVDQILPQPYSDISGRTMLPMSHITWASVWLGIAEHAVRKARTAVRAAARKNAGQLPPAAPQLARTYARLETVRATVTAAIDDYENARSDPELASSIGFAIRMNNLKLTTSTAVFEIVSQALSIIGLGAYRNDTDLSLGVQLRDALSAQLMVHNDRIIEHNAALLCVAKEG